MRKFDGLSLDIPPAVATAILVFTIFIGANTTKMFRVTSSLANAKHESRSFDLIRALPLVVDMTELTFGIAAGTGKTGSDRAGSGLKVRHAFRFFRYIFLYILIHFLFKFM